MMRLMPLVVSAILLGGCGGGGTSTTLPVATAAVLETFGDGGGVIRVIEPDADPSLAVSAVVPSDRATVRTVRIANADSAAAAFSKSDFLIDFEDLTVFLTDSLGDYYSGTATIAGKTATISAFKDRTAGTTIISAYDGTDKTVIASGTSLSNIPSGTYTYNGTNLVARMDNSWQARGTFTMNVDFGAGTGTLSGSSIGTTVTSINGSVTIDTSTGYYSGTGLTIVSPDGTSNAKIYGAFHGDGATGVSGIYFEDATTPLINGAIVGAR